MIWKVGVIWTLNKSFTSRNLLDKSKFYFENLVIRDFVKYLLQPDPSNPALALMLALLRRKPKNICLISLVDVDVYVGCDN